MTWYRRLAQWWMRTMAWDDRVLFAISATAHEVVSTRTALAEQIAEMANALQAQQESLRAEITQHFTVSVATLETDIAETEQRVTAALHARIDLVTKPTHTVSHVPTVGGLAVAARGCIECERLVSAYAIDRDGYARCLDCHEASIR